MHLLPGCSFQVGDEENEGYGKKRICGKCYEDQSIENWKGLAVPPKKRKRSSYLEINKEIKNIDFSSEKEGKPLGILKKWQYRFKTTENQCELHNNN